MIHIHKSLKKLVKHTGLVCGNHVFDVNKCILSSVTFECF